MVIAEVPHVGLKVANTIFQNAAVFTFTNVSLFNYEIVIHDVDDDDDDDNNDILNIFSFKVIKAWGKW